MQRNTRQKKIIKEYLDSVDIHPSADNVYEAVREKMPQISKATVYRVLKSFVRKGDALEISSDVSHFDGLTEEHAHFICRRCGSVRDIHNDKNLINYKKSNKFGKIDSFQLNFYGICKDCCK